MNNRSQTCFTLCQVQGPAVWGFTVLPLRCDRAGVLFGFLQRLTNLRQSGPHRTVKR